MRSFALRPSLRRFSLAPAFPPQLRVDCGGHRFLVEGSAQEAVEIGGHLRGTLQGVVISHREDRHPVRAMLTSATQEVLNLIQLGAEGAG